MFKITSRKPVDDLRRLWPDPDQLLTFVAAAAVVVGVLYRFAPIIVFGVDAPYGMGGLYMAFARQIFAEGFRIPATIPFYTLDGMPFAYFPLAFILEALFVYVLGVPIFAFVNLAPPAFSVLALILFGWLLLRFPIDRPTALVGLIVYALCLAGFDGHLDGGALVESLGTLAYVVLLHALWTLYQEPLRLRAWLWWAAACALCILSAPISAMAAVVLSGLLVVRRVIPLAFGHWKALVLVLGRMTLATSAVLVITAFYWWPVLEHHGIGILTGTFHSQTIGGNDYASQIMARVPGAPFMWDTGLNALVILGAIWVALKKKLMLLAWFVLPVLIPRDFSSLVAAPGAILAAHGAAALWKSPIVRRVPAAQLAIAALITAFVAANTGWGLFKRVPSGGFEMLTPSTVAALGEFAQLIPTEGRVIIIGAAPLLDWAPFLLQRSVLDVPYGAEWTPMESDTIYHFLGHVDACGDLRCISSRVREDFGTMHYYLVIDRLHNSASQLLAESHQPILASSGQLILLEVQPEAGAEPVTLTCDMRMRPTDAANFAVQLELGRSLLVRESLDQQRKAIGPDPPTARLAAHALNRGMLHWEHLATMDPLSIQHPGSIGGS